MCAHGWLHAGKFQDPACLWSKGGDFSLEGQHTSLSMFFSFWNGVWILSVLVTALKCNTERYLLHQPWIWLALSLEDWAHFLCVCVFFREMPKRTKAASAAPQNSSSIWRHYKGILGENLKLGASLQRLGTNTVTKPQDNHLSLQFLHLQAVQNCLEAQTHLTENALFFLPPFPRHRSTWNKTIC